MLAPAFAAPESTKTRAMKSHARISRRRASCPRPCTSATSSRRRIGPSEGRGLPAWSLRKLDGCRVMPARWPGRSPAGKSAACARCRGSKAARSGAGRQHGPAAQLDEGHAAATRPARRPGLVPATPGGCCARCAAPGVTHNDIAKPQNWLMTPEGRAAVIDFQLASVHRRRGRLFRTMAREDLRHLLKAEARLRAASADAVREADARTQGAARAPLDGHRQEALQLRHPRLIHWSDGEGTEDRIERDGPRPAHGADGAPAGARYRPLHLRPPAKGVGLYAFVETSLSREDLKKIAPGPKPELIQPVTTPAAPPCGWQPPHGRAATGGHQSAGGPRRAARGRRRLWPRRFAR